MGVGDQFTTENAGPWVWAMLGLRGSVGEHWQVSTTNPGEGHWAPKK
jgi:hypothetical protein